MEEAAAGAGGGIEATGVICLNDQGGSVMGTSVDVAGTLRAQEHGHQPVVCTGFQHKAGSKAHGIGYEEEKAPTLTSEQQCAVNIFGKQVIPKLVSSAFKGPGNTQDGFCVYDARGNGDGKTVCTLTGDHQDRVTDYTAIVMGVDCRNGTERPDVVATLQAHNSGGFSLNCTHPVRIEAQVRHLHRQRVLQTLGGRGNMNKTDIEWAGTSRGR